MLAGGHSACSRSTGTFCDNHRSNRMRSRRKLNPSDVSPYETLPYDLSRDALRKSEHPFLVWIYHTSQRRRKYFLGIYVTVAATTCLPLIKKYATHTSIVDVAHVHYHRRQSELSSVLSTDITHHPIELTLNSKSFLGGHEALQLGQRYRSGLFSSAAAEQSLWKEFSNDGHESNASEIVDELPAPEYPQVLSGDAEAKNQEEIDSECRLPEWSKLQFPTCNNFHEFRMIHADAESFLLQWGWFRMAFSMKEEEAGQPWYILKVMRWDENVFDRGMYELSRMDALLMERLNSSPRITDVYGFCGASITTEPLPGEIEAEALLDDPTGDQMIPEGSLHDQNDVDPKNDLEPTQKLELALEMAEALADLHGFRDGLIIHDDLDLGQFLRSEEGNLKLNDFNRGIILPRSRDGNCKFQRGKQGGKFRAPETYTEGGLLDEKEDIFPLGNCFYGLLTGLWPYYYDNDETAQKKLLEGEMPYLDDRYRTRSYAEGRLVEAIEMCHKRNPEERADIFAIVEHLRAALAENKQQRKIRGSLTVGNS